MTAHGFQRGHPIQWDETSQAWLWVDNGQAAVNWGGEERACPQCHLTADPTDGLGGVDPCLGVIDGALFACCGHGVEDGYVKWPTHEA